MEYQPAVEDQAQKGRNVGNIWNLILIKIYEILAVWKKTHTTHFYVEQWRVLEIELDKVKHLYDKVPEICLDFIIHKHVSFF